jgi:lysine/arginine/ornithine transport system substrate-binding protein
MNKLKTLLLLGCAAVSFSTFAQQATLKFGLEALYPPFESKSSTGQLQGFDIELGNAICQAADLQCSWFETSFDGLIPALQARKFDAINSAMNVTEKRRQSIDFTNIIYKVPTKLIARKEANLQPDVKVLKGKHIGVLQGSTQETFAKLHWAPQGVDIVSYQDQNQIYQDLTSGRLDGTLVLAPAGQGGFLAHPDGKDFAFAGDTIQDDNILGSGIAFGLRKGDSATKQKLDQAIAKVKQQGVIEQLSHKYFGNIDVSVK